MCKSGYEKGNGDESTFYSPFVPIDVSNHNNDKKKVGLFKRIFNKFKFKKNKKGDGCDHVYFPVEGSMTETHGYQQCAICGKVNRVDFGA